MIRSDFTHCLNFKIITNINLGNIGLTFKNERRGFIAKMEDINIKLKEQNKLCILLNSGTKIIVQK